MFDRSYHHRAGDHYTTIKQQPNDAADAARLYGEVQAKAESKVVKTVAEQLPSIEATYARIFSERCVMHLKDRHRIIFKINGKDFEKTVEREDHELWETTLRKECRILAEALADVIMERLASDILIAIKRHRL